MTLYIQWKFGFYKDHAVLQPSVKLTSPPAKANMSANMIVLHHIHFPTMVPV